MSKIYTSVIIYSFTLIRNPKKELYILTFVNHKNRSKQMKTMRFCRNFCKISFFLSISHIEQHLLIFWTSYNLKSSSKEICAFFLALFVLFCFFLGWIIVGTKNYSLMLFSHSVTWLTQKFFCDNICQQMSL